MEDVDKLQTQFENIDRLLEALLPFVSSERQNMLHSLHQMLEPMKHIKDIMKTMEMIQTMQSMMSNSPDGTPDMSMLAGFLNPEQMQMFEMFQSMQDMNL